ncbi:MAG: acetolactate decarboxylase [Chthoniobacterales bacterium]
MKFNRGLVLLFVFLGFSIARGGDILFQASAINALMQGVYDGTMTFGELGRHGDFGIGTVNALDGEMIAVDGRFYQALSNGKVVPIPAGMKTPFAEVTNFHAQQRHSLEMVKSFAELQRALDGMISSKNLFYAIKVTGTFSTIKFRSVERQRPPYRLLVDIVKTQSEFTLHNVRGTLVGFRCPPFVSGMNVPGYHFHFITDDKSKGGHVLDCVIQNARIELDALSDMQMVLPKNRQFLNVDLSGKAEAALKTVEQGTR